jgi:transcriptional regulator with XRE-family HTH domain
MQHITFPCEIYKLRKNKKISQKELAEILNIERSELSRIENGHYLPSQEILNQIVKKLVLPSEIYPIYILKQFFN